MDFSVVVLGWAGKFMAGGGVEAIKVIRILRPLRTINQIPNMPSLVATIMTSLPILLDVTILFMFALVMLGTIATQLLGGHLEKRCIYTDPKTGEEFINFNLSIASSASISPSRYLAHVSNTLNIFVVTASAG